jgi:hypothetical protein
MKMDKIEKYYKLKQDIERIDKFISEYFISQERKDSKVYSVFEFKLIKLFAPDEEGNTKTIAFSEFGTFLKLLSESFCEMRPELISRTLEKMKKNLAELREEIKIECNEFLTNECGSN